MGDAMELIFILFFTISPTLLMLGLIRYFDIKAREEREYIRAREAEYRRQAEALKEAIKEAIRENQRKQAQQQAKQQAKRKTVPWHIFLGVPPNANRDEINKAWKAKALIMHPDKGGSVKKMQSLNKAREIGLRLNG